MRNRLWIIILLIAWICQWATCWVVWQPRVELSKLVAYRASQRALGSRRGSGPRVRQHRRRKAGFRPPSAVQVENERVSRAAGEPGGTDAGNVYAPQRWGLLPEMVEELPERLQRFAERYQECFKTTTRNSGEYAYPYLSGLLRLETRRNYTNIGQATGNSGENIQHFMSNSPWSKQATMKHWTLAIFDK